MNPTVGIWSAAAGAVWVRKLVYLLLTAVVLAKLNAASACSMPNPPNDEDWFAAASTVFVGHIFRTEEIEVQLPGPGATRAAPALEGTFRLVEVLKGEPPAEFQKLALGETAIITIPTGGEGGYVIEVLFQSGRKLSSD